MNTKSRHRATGFTLVELILTITIMVLLAGMIVGGFAFVRQKQAESAANLQIALLSRGIDEYRLDMGVYPGVDGSTELGGDARPAAGDNSQVLYQALFYHGWNFINSGRPTTWNRATTIYLSELDPNDTSQGWLNPITGSTPPQNLKIIDPWGNNYRYRVGSNAVNPDFDLWSVGKDSLTQPGTGGNYDSNHPQNRDDIRNF